MSRQEALVVAEKLFKLLDKRSTGFLDLDQLVEYVAEVRRMEIIPVDEAYIVQKLQEDEAERITFAQFKEWSGGPDVKIEEEVEVKKDPFGNSSVVPDRFRDAHAFKGKVKVQHPCYTTTSHDIGIKNPSQVDMPVKWRGKEGTFTRMFEMSEPGKSVITINTYKNRGLRTNKTVSKVHKEFDIDF